MRVLVTGTDGYIGTLLAPRLMEQGFEVTGIDTGFYRDAWIYNNGIRKFPLSLFSDIRDVEEEHFKGFDAVVHLAELSNDPLGEIDPRITFQINYLGSARLARLCRSAGAKRFVYTSSCSVYGAGGGEIKTEESSVAPQTAYAECKSMVERDVTAMATDDFSPVFLRNATAYGPSPRMRFDLVLNNLAGMAWTTGQIRVTSDGSPWRPLVHLLDICDAVIAVLKAPREVVHRQVFNVGKTSENYRVRELAEIVAQTFPSCTLSFGTNDSDNRSYRVSFDKIERVLGFCCRRNVHVGAEQLRDLFEKIRLTPDVFEARPYTRLKKIRYLLESGQIDRDFFWR
ncbi:MAG: SDR family oxidoreductase [Acidobacteria bacterium]|nr:MAG: SDR family oxidoreductase [Acidobacteriota bacterium]